MLLVVDTIMMVAISLRIASCLVLNRRSSHATLQVLRMWIRVYLAPQSGQASLSLFPHNVKFALCGRVSTALFRANLMCSSGHTVDREMFAVKNF